MNYLSHKAGCHAADLFFSTIFKKVANPLCYSCHSTEEVCPEKNMLMGSNAPIMVLFKCVGFFYKIVGGKLFRLLTWDIFHVKKNIEIKC